VKIADAGGAALIFMKLPNFFSDAKNDPCSRERERELGWMEQ